MRSLYPYQEKALAYCLKNRHPALFMEMRLGKSLVTIRACQQKQAKKILIVGPLSTFPDWQDELKEEGVRYVDVDRTSGYDFTVPGYYLVNYERLRIESEITNLNWDVVVLDESTRIKNPKAEITKVCTKNFRDVSHRFILSGLPAPEGPEDFFTQFQFLRSGFMGCRNYWNWRENNFRQIGYDWFPKAGMLGEIKKTANEQAFVLTRKEAGIGDKPVPMRRVVQATAIQNKYMREALESFEFDGNLTKFRVVVETWLQRLAGGFHPTTGECLSNGKTKEILTLLQGELKNQKVIIYFR